MLQFRGWWIDRLQEEGLTANSANRILLSSRSHLEDRERSGANWAHLESLVFFTEEWRARHHSQDHGKTAAADALNGLIRGEGNFPRYDQHRLSLAKYLLD
jgi:hypothetical protein